MSNLSTNGKERRLEQLVAYLDGELTPVEASLVERQLAEDADLRLEMQNIERAWSALDALPTTKVDDRFSQTTLELVVGVARDEVLEKTRALPIQQRRDWLKTVLLTIAAAFLGLLAVRLVRENPNRTLIAELPAIQYIDIYSQFRDMDFLQRLRDELGDDIWVADLSEEALAEQMTEFRTVADADERHDWIMALSDEDRRTLLARYNQFTSSMPLEQSRLRDLHSALVASPDSEQLERTMLQYREWLGALPASRQYELRDMPIDDRVRTIATEVRRQANNPWILLTPEEFRKLERVRLSILEQARSEWRDPERGDGDERRGREDRNRGPNFGRQVVRYMQDHRDEWRPQILAMLTEEHRAKFDALSERRQQQQLVYWIMQSRDLRGPGGRGPFAQVTQQELEQFFVDETSPADKERLLALPRAQMEQELRRRYMRSFLGDDFRPELGPFRPRGRGGPGPGRGRPGDREGFELRPFEGPAPEGFGPPPPRPEDEF